MKFTDDMKELISKQLAYIATVDNNGLPNIGPKRTMRILEDGKFIYCENTGGRHHANIKDNGKIIICYVDRDNNHGYRFEGRAESYTDDEHIALAEKTVGVKPKAATIIINIEKIYTLDSGPKAGKSIG
ncbi:pyridoxamine 5'-phosphate oxidase family protein [Anaerococcus sp. AGMB00486]|uniref:Pyridoxamine 5'-phosphate oxidase family protein n=1 Tax=Anaerococcus faecalis TaxID=2742993 RepID=A0ABX2N8D7_9FIRM|nr:MULTISPECIES: pyridoxamine 5'-phosphate oxidase family protein [Anaerococcus]MDY3007019.1 pyridoxamine 5'-phosphate oxidase family protein [Anaerococcus porci]NVF10961.1 pyridoxamine 5'-phosphate oxidase family protein [Anaerococcus faecalis]